MHDSWVFSEEKLYVAVHVSNAVVVEYVILYLYIKLLVYLSQDFN